MKPVSFLIAAASGLASALLFAGLVFQSSSAVSFALATPIPIAIASLGWGSLAGFIAAAVSVLTIFVMTGSFGSALTLLLAMALPIALAGHVAGLSRPREDGGQPAQRPNGGDRGRAAQGADAGRPAFDWYPIERILAILAGFSALACILIGLFIGYDPDHFVSAFVEALRASAGEGLQNASDDQLRGLARTVIGLVPFVQPAVLVITLVVGLYVAAWITRLSGRLERPKDDLPTATSLPALALAIFASAVVASFAGGTVGLLADVVIGALAAAFSLVGLAVMHRRTRGRQGRGLILFASYAAILLLSFPIALFLGLGIYDSIRRARSPHAPGS